MVECVVSSRFGLRGTVGLEAKIDEGATPAEIIHMVCGNPSLYCCSSDVCLSFQVVGESAAIVDEHPRLCVHLKPRNTGSGMSTFVFHVLRLILYPCWAGRRIT